MNDDETAEISRLRRQLRAMSAVTRQLQAQLAAVRPGTQTKLRRYGQADPWIHDLERVARPTQVELYVTDAGKIWLREGGVRRHVNSGLLAMALEQEFGARVPIATPALEQWPEGPPVVVLEATSGPPFLVVGGERLPLRGLPVPYPVPSEAAGKLPEGVELDVWRAATGQKRSRRATWTSSTSDLPALARKVGRRGKREVRRFTSSGGT